MLWIGVDAHTRVHQAVALGQDGELGERTISNTPAGWASLLVWAQQWSERLWPSRAGDRWAEAWPSSWPGKASRCTRSPQSGPRSVRRRRKPGKSDGLDALAVAHLLREEAAGLPVVLPEEEAVATVQLWSRLR